jgi:hypothetical protein
MQGESTIVKRGYSLYEQRKTVLVKFRFNLRASSTLLLPFQRCPIVAIVESESKLAKGNNREGRWH